MHTEFYAENLQVMEHLEDLDVELKPILKLLLESERDSSGTG
jgi:hypothetical protein